MSGHEPLWSFPGGLGQLDRGMADGFRRMLAGFVYWLASRQGLSYADPDRGAQLSGLSHSRSDPARTIERLGDQLLHTDVVDQVRPFAQHYLRMQPGHLSNDWWEFFVERDDRADLSEVDPDLKALEAFGQVIDQRLKQFTEQSPKLWEPLTPVAKAPPWSGANEEDWLSDLGVASRALSCARPSQHRTSLLEYWSVVDAAPSFVTASVARALAETWLEVTDFAVQQSVSRALHHFPAEIIVAGLLPVLPRLGAESEAAVELLSTISTPWSPRQLDQIVALLRVAPASQVQDWSRTLVAAATEDYGDSGLLMAALQGRGWDPLRDRQLSP